MAAKIGMGKSKEQIIDMANKKKDMLSSGDTTANFYKDFVLNNIKREDIEKGVKSKSKVEDIVESSKDSVVELDISTLSESPKNCYEKVTGDKRDELKASLEAYGQITPIIVRHKKSIQHYSIDNKFEYEILVGHTRTQILKELGKDKIKAIVVDVDDVKATLLIAQSNIQREKISEMELATAYKNTYEAYVLELGGADRGQGRKSSKDNKLEETNQKEYENSEPLGNTKRKSNSHVGNLINGSDSTLEKVAKLYGLSKNTFHRKMALANCTSEVVELFNKGKLKQAHTYYISRMDDITQNHICAMLQSSKSIMNEEKAKKLWEEYKVFIEENPYGTFPLVKIENILADEEKEDEEERKPAKPKVNKAKSGDTYKIPMKYFPENLSYKERLEFILKALSLAYSNDFPNDISHEN